MLSDRLYTRLSMTAPAWMLRLTGKVNVPLYKLTRGRLFGSIGKAPVLLLTTTGRKSGQERTAPVVYLELTDRLVVIGSNAGNTRPPAWSLNLKANPDSVAQTGGRKRPVRARVAEGEERETLWRLMTKQYTGFDDYEAATNRDIAVFVLEPR